MSKSARNVGASVRSRLLTLARAKRQPFDILLTRYVLERLLYRLSLSPYRDRFVLKGALLITTWFVDPHRPTRDLDLLGFGDSSPEAVLAIFREVCGTHADDGVTFDAEKLRIDLIREELEYGGLRLRTVASVSGARITVVVDIGFGDAVEPGLEEIDLPVLLDFPPPHLRAYPRETVIAEKFQAMVALGRANSRMKDFYDLWVLIKGYEFEPDRLTKAIAATFGRRRTAIPTEVPDALSLEFGRDTGKRQQWDAFVRDLTVNPGPLDSVVEDLATFLMPIAASARALVRDVS